MPTKLRKLKIIRVAVCPQGANPDADILLFKSAAVAKQAGVTVGDVYPDTSAGTARCTDPHCADPDCPVHGALVRARRAQRRVTKDLRGVVGPSGEPDGDEATPLDYATRGQQADLWDSLWHKWHCLQATFLEVCGDCDDDNVPHLPVLERSIGQFHEDVAQLLEDCGIRKQFLDGLHGLVEACRADVGKAGAAMATHRRTRLHDAIAVLQQILDECTPDDLPHGTQPPIDRAGVSAADVVGLSGTRATPALSKGAPARAVRKTDAADTEHCATCAVEDCDNPAHERMTHMNKQDETGWGEGAKEQLATLRARAEAAEAKVEELQPLVAKVAGLETTLAKMRQTPEEQEAEYWAGVPEPVRKKHEADEAEKVELRKQLNDARADREQTVYMAKTADFRSFGMVPQTHWRLVKAIDAMGEEDRDELWRLIKAAQEHARTAGLFSTVGVSGATNGESLAGGSANDRLMALTTAYMDEKGVDFLKASEVIAKSHRDLYAEANRERRLASRVSS